MKIHETFQQTIQGEGANAGMLCDFIRLYGCPVGCAWCDTGYADGGKNIDFGEKTIPELIAELQSPNVVISGGEPFLHKELGDLCAAIAESGRRPYIETSGVYWREIQNFAWITLSPKEHLGRYATSDFFWHRANEIKIVIDTGMEWEFYEKKLPGHTPIYLQPQWNNPESLMITLGIIKQNPDARLSIQTHKFLGIQ